MTNKTNSLENFIIRYDGEYVDNSFEPSVMEQTKDLVLGGLTQAVEAARLEVRMFMFDAMHHTNYRAIRHQLIEDQKRAEFEASIGLKRL